MWKTGWWLLALGCGEGRVWLPQQSGEAPTSMPADEPVTALPTIPACDLILELTAEEVPLADGRIGVSLFPSVSNATNQPLSFVNRSLCLGMTADFYGPPDMDWYNECDKDFCKGEPIDWEVVLGPYERVDLAPGWLTSEGTNCNDAVPADTKIGFTIEVPDPTVVVCEAAPVRVF